MKRRREQNGIMQRLRRVKQNHPYVRRWFEDVHLRVNVSLFGGFLWNLIYAGFQFGLGAYHDSFWYHSMGAYYLLLALMRLNLVCYTKGHKPGENQYQEFVKYRSCGWFFLFINLAFTLMMFFMVYWNRTFYHHEITTIAMASYTFASFTMAGINLVKYRKYNSPVFSASRMISFAAACVSILTLESTMLTTFGSETMDLFTRRLFLGLSGGAISGVLVSMALFMIIQSNKKLRQLRKQEAALLCGERNGREFEDAL